MGRPMEHGECFTRLYDIWACMKYRCSNRNQTFYHRYGGRGITVCDEWLNFIPFRDWALSNGYRDDLTIDRIDNNGNYEPSNCRWITMKEQNKNRYNIRLYNGLTVTEWANKLNVKRRTLVGRLERGWSWEKTLTTPFKSRSKRNG